MVWTRVILLLVFAGAAHAAKTPTSEICKVYGALAPQQMLQIRPEFMARHEQRRYTLELPERPIRNQCKYGGCWAYQTLSYVERKMQNTHGRDFDLSEPYLILKDLQEKSRNALEEPGHEIKAGSLFGRSVELVRAYGVVPQSAWQPRVSFEDAGHGERLMGFLNGRVARYHLEAAGKSASEKARLKAEAQADLDAILYAYSGPMPTSFEENGRHYESPQAYWQENGVALSQIRRVLVKREPVPAEWKKLEPAAGPSPALPTVASPEPQGPSKPPEVHKPIEAIAKGIVEALERGDSVPVSLELDRRFIDKKTGIMSIRAFPAPEGVGPVPSAYRQFFQMTDGVHAMEIVGIERDAEGKVVRFKARNSWGEQSGENGYYHIYADYFREYLVGATLPNVSVPETNVLHEPGADLAD